MGSTLVFAIQVFRSEDQQTHVADPALNLLVENSCRNLSRFTQKNQLKPQDISQHSAQGFVV
jgi:hypothetical protein